MSNRVAVGGINYSGAHVCTVGADPCVAVGDVDVGVFCLKLFARATPT